MNKIKIAVLAFASAVSAAPCYAAGLFDATGVSVDTSSMTTILGVTIPVLLGLLVVRKIVKSTNRT